MEAKGREMEVHPVEMKEIFTYLVGMQDQFNHFADKFLKLSSYMLDIWQSGGARSHIEDEVNRFKSQLDTFRQNFDQAISFLEQAIQNREA